MSWTFQRCQSFAEQMHVQIVATSAPQRTDANDGGQGAAHVMPLASTPCSSDSLGPSSNGAWSSGTSTSGSALKAADMAAQHQKRLSDPRACGGRGALQWEHTPGRTPTERSVAQDTAGWHLLGIK